MNRNDVLGDNHIPEPPITGTEHIRTHFDRARRNLIVVSVLLFVGIYAGVRVLESLSFLGVGLHIDHPERLDGGLWIAWFYCLVRYLQSLRDLSDTGLESRRANWIHRAARAEAIRRAKQEAMEKYKLTGPETTSVQFFVSFAERQYFLLRDTYSFVVHLGIQSTDDQGTKTDRADSFDTVIHGPVVREIVRKSWRYVILETTWATEYVLPLVVAFVPVVVVVAPHIRSLFST